MRWGFHKTNCAVLDWAEQEGILSGSTVAKQMARLREELDRLAEALESDDRDATAYSIGDILIILSILGKMLNMDIQLCYMIAFVSINDRMDNKRCNCKKTCKKLKGEKK